MLFQAIINFDIPHLKLNHLNHGMITFTFHKQGGCVTGVERLKYQKIDYARLCFHTS